MKLFKNNSQFEFVKGSCDKTAFLGIGPIEQIKENYLILLSEKKFFNQFIAHLPQDICFKLSLLFSKDLFTAIENDPQWLAVENKVETIILTKDFPRTLTQLSHFFHQKAYEKIDLMIDGRDDGSVKIHPSAKIGKSCFIGQNVTIEEGAIIHPHCHIGANSHIGKETILFAHLSIYPFTKIGDRCRLHSHVTVGADGFGYQFIDGVHQKMWHFGGVEIGDEVEVGANSCIDGGTFYPTTIGQGTKIDNHVQIGHNCQIGKHVLLCGQVALGGSAKLEDYVVFGGKAGCGPSIELGTGCQVGGGGLVNNSWPAGTKLGGHPARPLKEWMKGLATIRKLSLDKNKGA
ncbi:MAG: UDP-3-O-(3-hydroxymyristoyl)glucosamine N-acyltransferase [Bdellovibrionales bacterium]|jgi:UDP-3-O-[3-hydroxymyristoyl] glucosamine N-acyltransferase|nr:UDP-3-O-(3-hydroxymyristoyl)glucosamine N-acyltransferase [Bdellovibrionales bacterium]